VSWRRQTRTLQSFPRGLEDLATGFRGVPVRGRPTFLFFIID